MDRIPDPYRELGILRGATDTQVKAAHRRLAKRFHPDAPEGDHDRFLAIQEAYSLLSDALRRRDWDAKHTSGPVRAGDPGPRRGGRGTVTPRTAREPGGEGARRGAGRGGGAGRGSAPGNSAPGSGSHAGGAGEAERAGGAWSASDRDPSSRSTTWSASGVPWWEDFSPRDRGAGSAGAGSAGAGSTGSKGGAHAPRAGGAGTTRGAAPGAAGTWAPAGTFETAGTGSQRTTAHRSPEDVDVYSRSSGAAWSMAARRYFRKGEAELPKGGAWTYRGTQVVTGAEVGKVSEEEAARKRAADALLRSRAARSAPPRTPFRHQGGRETAAYGSPPPGRAPPPGARSTRPAPGATPASAGPSSVRPTASASAASAVPPSVRPPVRPPSTDASFLHRVRRALGLG